MTEQQTEENLPETVAIASPQTKTITEKKSQDDNNNLNSSTMSTQLSTDQLICKTPQDSPANSIKSNQPKRFKHQKSTEENFLIYTGCFQIFSGIFMLICGFLAIMYDSSLSQVLYKNLAEHHRFDIEKHLPQTGGGIWGGGLAITTGVLGVIAAAKSWCPLKTTPQKMVHTVFLALSLISLAISQLVVALASMGLVRDYNNLVYGNNQEDGVSTTQSPPPGTIYITLPVNYPCLLCNIGLIIIATIECIVAAIASYKSSRILCPCFRKQQLPEDTIYRNAFVNSWLGKHSPPPQIFVVAAPSTLNGKESKLEFPPLTPIFAIPPPPMPVSYPLIPAPLGTIPSPIIPPPSRRELLHHHRKYLSKLKSATEGRVQKSRSRAKSRSKDDKVREEDVDVTKTYTGLDKMIAEEFIDICDSKNTSLCSDSSCTSSCNRSCNMTNSDVSSRDYLVNKL